MARPLQTAKKTVTLPSEGPRVSKIRRDPPPPEKVKELRHPDVVDRTTVAVGVLVCALAIFVIIIAVSSYNGWSPKQYTVELNYAE